MVHYFVRSGAERDAYVAEMRPLAKKYDEYLRFATTDANEYPDMLRAMGLPAGAARGLAVQNPSNGDVFPYRGGQGITAAVVEAFLVDIISGRVPPWTGEAGGDERAHEEL